MNSEGLSPRGVFRRRPSTVLSGARKRYSSERGVRIMVVDVTGAITFLMITTVSQQYLCGTDSNYHTMEQSHRVSNRNRTKFRLVAYSKHVQ